MNSDVAEKIKEAMGAGKGKSVALVFSVNMSGHFQGYAFATSRPVAQNLEHLWGSASQSLSHALEVEWAYGLDLPFGEAKHLKNALNSGKSVGATKHGQEIDLKSGRELCKLFRSKAEKIGVSKCGAPTKPFKLQEVSGEASGKSSKRSASNGSSSSRPGKVQKRVDTVLNLLDISYDEYLSLFDTFKSISAEFLEVGKGAPLLTMLEGMSPSEKSDIAANFSKDDFMDVCRIVCVLNNVEYSSKLLVQFYDRIYDSIL